MVELTYALNSSSAIPSSSLQSFSASHFLQVTMFSSLGRFKQTECPCRTHCTLPNCLFLHLNQRDEDTARPPLLEAPSLELVDNGRMQSSTENTRKRPHTDTDVEILDKSPARPLINGSSKLQSTGKPSQSSSPSQTMADDDERSKFRKTSNGMRKPSYREISPLPIGRKPVDPRRRISIKEETQVRPPAKHPQRASSAMPNRNVAEGLNPRMIHSSPAAHSVRAKFVDLLHEQFVRLNHEVKISSDPSKIALEISSQELITAALDEEETTAKRNPRVYTSVLKLRISALKKMTFPSWKLERLKQLDEASPAAPVASQPEPIITGLSSVEEVDFLQRLLAPIGEWAKYGYVPTMPSSKEVDDARQGVEAAKGWEQCDRCKTRFQVFPGRREDGTLTSGGACNYHHGKLRVSTAATAEKGGLRERLYTCCNEGVGVRQGCTQATTHVFKISDPKRLALVMPFRETPPNNLVDEDYAICIDCEMAYTTYGMEMVRLTATSWPVGETILDLLVKPLGEILDLNTRFSGITLDDFVAAVPYDTAAADEDLTASQNKGMAPKFITSPLVARDLLFERMTPETVIIGHALENDLNTTRIIHPNIVDTVKVFEHPRGLPQRFGLKALARQHLQRDIQTGGADGHDSKEDAKAAGDLVRYHIGKEWRSMKSKGWTVEGGKFKCPPELEADREHSLQATKS